jgi:nitroimidazol reductase NimA-like FMN-containing flavoprotein (pyridoxamine 5'-phosphate oxidase superfamily)
MEDGGMRYEMRRKDRQISSDESYIIIDRALFGVMATVDCDGAPYAVPLNFVREGDVLYFHGAMEGHKIDNLKERPDVCITFVGALSFPEKHFTTVFESAILFGKAEEVTDDKEKIHGLKLICQRFIPNNMNAFDSEIDKQLKATSVWKIKIETISGKRRIYP